jgi:hypothetical protein
MHPTTRAALVAAVVAIGSPAIASSVPNFGFAGDYAPSKWSPTTSAPNYAGALVMGSEGAMLYSFASKNTTRAAELTAVATASGPVSFDWNFIVGLGRPHRGVAEFGYTINGNRTMLASNLSATGTASFAVNTGDVFGWYTFASSPSGYFGTSSAIHGLQAPVPAPATPTPGPLALLGVAAMFKASRRLRRRIALG